MSEELNDVAVEPINEEPQDEQVVQNPDADDAETLEEEGDTSEDQGEDDDGESEEKPKRKTGFQKRIDELTKARHEAEQRAEELAKKHEELRLSIAQQQQEAQQQQIQSNFPKLADFDYDEGKYQQAIGQYYHAQEQQRQVSSKVMKAVEKYPDFIEKLQDPSLPSIQASNPVAFQAVAESDMMGDLVYHLANNPHEIHAFRAMSPMQAIKAVARLEDRLSQPVENEPRPQVKQPPPAPPTKLSGGSGPVEKDPRKMSAEDWMAWRTKQLNSKR